MSRRSRRKEQLDYIVMDSEQLKCEELLGSMIVKQAERLAEDGQIKRALGYLRLVLSEQPAYAPARECYDRLRHQSEPKN